MLGTTAAEQDGYPDAIHGTTVSSPPAGGG
jgi:hypothetical protein